MLAPIEALGLQSIFTTLFSYNHNAGTWFISCLLICYFLYPISKKIIERFDKKRKIILCVLFGIIIVYSAYIVKWTNISSLYTNPFIRFFEFAIGVILGTVWKESNTENIGHKKYIYYFGMIALFTGTIILFETKRYNDFMLYSWIVLPCSVLLIYYSTCLKVKKGERIIQYLSSLSYSFFLAQLFSNNICKLIIHNFDISSNILKICIGWISCMIIALFLHHIIEVPVKKWLRGKLAFRY